MMKFTQPVDQFYPTPDNVIRKMLWDVKIVSPILEPSAGKGNILEYIENHKLHHASCRSLYAIELDPELRVILKEKGYTVLDSDFLAFQEHSLRFNLIVMNPPFNDADSHILHAWEFVADGGELVALCNTETVQNPHSKERQLLVNLIEKYGTVESLGRCFTEAERSANVDVSLIKLKKPKGEPTIGFDAKNFDFNSVEDAEFAANPIASSNYLESLVAQYKRAESIILQRQELSSELEFYLQGIASSSHSRNDLTLSKIASVKLDHQIADLKARFWNTVLQKANIASRLTGKFKTDFEGFRQQQKHMSFSVDNVREMLFMFFGNYNEIMSKCLLEMFDRLTQYCKENQVHTEGWVTNKGYRLNHKVIYPYGVQLRYETSFSCYRSSEVLDDLDKIMCWLDGAKFEELGLDSTYRVLDRFCSEVSQGKKSYTEKVYSRYFEIRIFKKGTLHLIFRDRKLLNDFNIKAAQGKKWLGGDGY